MTNTELEFTVNQIYRSVSTISARISLEFATMLERRAEEEGKGVRDGREDELCGVDLPYSDG